MPADFYVSPFGNDAWSGKLSAPEPGRGDGPFATVRRARDAVRALLESGRRSGSPKPVTVELRQGTFAMVEPLRLGPEDSGSEGAPVSWRPYPGERALLSGGRRLTGWRRETGGTWSLSIPEAASGDWYFRSLWVNGERRHRPRLPKEGVYTVAGRAEQRDRAFQYRTGEIDPSWHARDDVEVVVIQFWAEARLRIASIDEGSRTVSFTGASWRPLDWSKAWFVENVREALTNPGEWYLDRASGLLRYLALPGEDPNRDEVVAPVAETLVEMEGPGDRFVEWVAIEGLSLVHTAWRMPTPHGISIPQAEIPRENGVLFAGNLAHGVSLPQVAVPVPATIRAGGIRHCRISGCEIAHTGGWAVELGSRCVDSVIQGNSIHDIGAGAIRIGTPDCPSSDADETCRIEVTDNRIRDGSRVYLGPAAIWIGQSGSNRVAHNEITGAFEWGISVGWNWNYWPPNRHRDNIIELNHIHHVGEGHTGCHGAIYFLGVSPGTICRQNHLHDLTGGACGIILDNACFGILVENNLVHHTDAAGICFNYNDSGNIVQNNIFAMSRSFAFERYGDPPATSGEKVDQTGILYRNIFTWKEGTFLMRKEWVNFDTLMNYNLYWDASGKSIDFAGLTLEGWRGKGLDRSGVVADPLFRDADSGDFTIPESSPAFRLGFRPIDVRTAGPRRTP